MLGKTVMCRAHARQIQDTANSQLNKVALAISLCVPFLSTPNFNPLPMQFLDMHSGFFRRAEKNIIQYKMWNTLTQQNCCSIFDTFFRKLYQPYLMYMYFLAKYQ